MILELGLILAIIIATIDYKNFENTMTYYDALFARRECLKGLPNNEYSEID